MTLWIILILLCLVALGFIVWPLYRHSGRLTPYLAGSIVLIVAVSSAMYHNYGSPTVPSGASVAPNVDDMVASLENRLKSSPDDVDGWLMLGRSYQNLQRPDDAIVAFEKAIELEDGKNAHSLVALAIVLMEQNGGNLPERSVGLFESALELDPMNANALFYAGGAAARRGDVELAADRWEILLGPNTPPEVQTLLQSKINEWRGLPSSQGAPVSAGFSVTISVSDAAREGVPVNARVFVIAREPGKPGPPIAVRPMALSDLPTTITLTDSDAMLPGRPLSGFSKLEIIARVSLSGAAMAQSGDWFGSSLIDLNQVESGIGPGVEIAIDKKVP